MAGFADGPDEILRVSNRKVYIWVSSLPDGSFAVDYEARPAVIARAIDAPPPPRRRVAVAKTREEALTLARERLRMMFHMRKLVTVDPRKLAYH